jgi:hypothetical protein
MIEILQRFVFELRHLLLAVLTIPGPAQGMARYFGGGLAP